MSTGDTLQAFHQLIPDVLFLFTIFQNRLGLNLSTLGREKI